MESNDDTANAERILYNITPRALIDVITEAYEQGKEMENEAKCKQLNKLENRPVSNDENKVNENVNTELDSKPNSTVELNVDLSEIDEQTSDKSSNLSDLKDNKPKGEENNPEQVLDFPTTFFINDDKNVNESIDNNESEGTPPREVGHNVFILAHKLAKYNKELSALLKSKDNEALFYYSGHTAQIEIIREDRAMEQIVFPVPTICEYLTKETKQRIFLMTEKDEQNSKITGFFQELDSMWNEMKWQRKLRQSKWLYWFSAHMSLWSDISFNFAVLINLLVAIFYPFDKTISGIILL
jgi:hypothetical protein